ncbi:type III-A CRISPR-associated RAMP protein Csm3 [Prosthecochloris sp. ZM]|uniref:type III-A CRISPR-associated RAMP protein Csm3 n=1 Tax=Prosthecochloris sp. ZM TaxID=2283143 RepID=UPI000DF782C6|nr:type III-A CRISPR-associated RAMP protein Csm3 [Prosthecochloris sp. ZM]RDD29475.1 type III-A CRISPR-associated RAMP protein Csm3 [Prosthecochloris sp. ZM]
MHKLIGKAFISGRIVVKTGLHIGGSKTVLDIGGVDLNVIKTHLGVPYIPGSSLKGKLRSILAREEGSLAIKREPGMPSDMTVDSENINTIFGKGADKEAEGAQAQKTPEKCLLTRLIVRDALLDTTHFRKHFYDIEPDDKDFEDDLVSYTEIKTENTINRMTGTAQHPRQLERVPANAEFDFEIIYNIFDEEEKVSHLNALMQAMRILEDDYLGGSGSRGYGQIGFKGMKYEYKSTDEYKNGNKRKALDLKGITSLD